MIVSDNVVIPAINRVTALQKYTVYSYITKTKKYCKLNVVMVVKI